MGWISRLLGRPPSTPGSRLEENQSTATRAEIAYEFVCKATEMQAQGAPIANIKITLIQLARARGYKNAKSTDNSRYFELNLNSKDKIVFDGIQWNSVIDLD